MSDSIINNLMKDVIFTCAISMAQIVSATIFMVKLFNYNDKLLVNKLLIISLFSYMGLSIIVMIECVSDLVNVPFDGNDHFNKKAELVVSILQGVFMMLTIIPFVIVLNLRNSILIKNKKILLFTKILIVIIISFIIAYIITIIMRSLSSETGYSNIVAVNVIVSALHSCFTFTFEIISNIYLLFYYNKYYFNSTSVMKHLRFQMIYRRNWIYFVIILEILSMSLTILMLLGIYAATISMFQCLILLFDINAMIDFVKFDIIRNEITIGDQTIYYYEDSKNINE